MNSKCLSPHTLTFLQGTYRLTQVSLLPHVLNNGDTNLVPALPAWASHNIISALLAAVSFHKCVNME